MTAIWQQREGNWRLLEPAGFPDEATLHDQVEEGPQLLPLAGSPLLAVLGREVRLGSGLADLIAVEDSGRPVVIEIKLASNSEARRAVVAQVLAYAAYLFGLTAPEFGDVLGKHLRERGHDSVFGAISAVDQAGRIDSETFTKALEANLAAGRFRLVLVLDEAPDELVKLVGYLEAVTPELVIDLVTVAMYDVGGSNVLVPQRVDPERAESEATAPVSTRSGGAYSTEGVDDFLALIEEASVEGQPQLRRMGDWVRSLEVDGLVGKVWTLHGASGVVTLLPYLPVDDAGLVTVYHTDSGGYIAFWRSVFERRAPNALVAVERAAAPAQVKQHSTTYEVTDELLDALTEAYREAIQNIRA